MNEIGMRGSEGMVFKGVGGIAMIGNALFRDLHSEPGGHAMAELGPRRLPTLPFIKVGIGV